MAGKVTVAAPPTTGVAPARPGHVGPWALGLVARVQVRRAGGRFAAELLLAAHRPGRTDSRLAAGERGGPDLLRRGFRRCRRGGHRHHAAGAPNPEDILLLADLRTGIALTLVISFVTVAASVAVNQGADILERRELFTSLERIGMPLDGMDRARRLAVLSPLRVVALGSAAAAALLVLPPPCRSCR